VPTPDSRLPILVGAAAIQQHEDDPDIAREPVELMIAALAAAADDAGNRDLLARASSIRAPRGFWSYPDPCRLIAARFGAADARTEVGEIGVLQTTFFGRAACDIAAGRADVVLLAGGEARHRSRCAMRRGATETFAAQDPSIVPDEILRPARDVLDDLELARGVAMPVYQYSMIENALRAAEGQSVDAHRDEIAELWAAFSAVAAANPDAWNRTPASAAVIRGAASNRMLAFPYTVLHTSQWNVDQASGFILTSVATARAMGIAEHRWLYPHAVVDSNLMLALSERRDPHRCAGFARAAQRVEQIAGVPVAAADHLELYSCFPAAVRVQMREMNISRDRPVTVTGGMAFAGGPLNNFAFQALAKMAGILRDDAGSTGVVTAVSGMLTKQGVSLWSTAPPRRPFQFADVSDDTARDSQAVAVVEPGRCEARIATYTVITPDREGRLVALVDLDDGARTIVSSSDADLVQLATHDELCGRRVGIDGPDILALR
jgi:acetyl-CoA C-acetyltransferase